jgi:hypothetical protein
VGPFLKEQIMAKTTSDSRGRKITKNQLVEFTITCQPRGRNTLHGTLSGQIGLHRFRVLINDSQKSDVAELVLDWVGITDLI